MVLEDLRRHRFVCVNFIFSTFLFIPDDHVERYVFTVAIFKKKCFTIFSIYKEFTLSISNFEYSLFVSMFFDMLEDSSVFEILHTSSLSSVETQSKELQVLALLHFHL
jgi:hypothetical protein